MAERERITPGQRTSWAFCLVPLPVSLALYCWTLAPTVTGEDSGELIAAAWHFGIPHPPGYPLWTMLCGLFIRLLPAADIAWRANLFSALCSALSTVPLCAALRELGVRRSAAISTALIWAWSGTLWSQSVITEVYGLNALMCTLLLWCFIRWHVGQHTRWLIAAGGVLGLGMCNHHTIGFFALALGLWALALKPRLAKDGRLILLCLAAFAAGLLPYVYLPLRARAQPPVNWGDPATLKAFVEHVTRAQYGWSAPLKVREGRSLRRFAQQCAYVAGVVAEDLSLPVLLLALSGCGLLAGRRSALGGLVLLALLSCGIGFILLSNIDLDRTMRFASKVFLIPLAVAMALPISHLLDRFSNWVADRHTVVLSRAVTALVLALPVLPLAANYHRCNYSDYWLARDHARNLLACMLPGAVIFPSGDHSTFPLMYLTLVERVRPDITIADMYGYVDRRVIAVLAAERGLPLPHLTSEADRQEWIIRQARRPVYYSTKQRPPVEHAEFVAVGILYHLLPEGWSLDRDGPWLNISYANLNGTPTVEDMAAAHILSEYYFFRALDELRRNQTDAALQSFATSAEHAWGFEQNINNIGSALAEHGHATEALTYFEEARRLDKYYATPRRNLVRIYHQRGDWQAEEHVLEELVFIDPGNDRALRRLGDIAAEQRNHIERARQWWRKSLAVNPDQPDLAERLPP